MEEKKFKICKVCNQGKDIELMAVKTTNKDTGKVYYKNICKICDNIRCRERKRGTKNEIERHKDYYQRNKDKFKAYSRNNRLEKLYNMTQQDYEDMVKYQNNKCLICEKEKLLVIDHCHTTGKVRGLLCGLCNSGIGHLKDNIENLKRAIAYLENN